MKFDAYKKANNSITVSEEKESEILSMLKIAVESERRKNTINIERIFAACLFFLIGVSLVVFVGIGKCGYRSDAPSDTTEKTLEENLFFNPGKLLYESKKLKNHTDKYVGVKKSVSYRELPNSLTAALLLPPSPPYDAENDMFILKYYEDGTEFVVEEKTFINPSDGSVVSVYAESENNTILLNKKEWRKSRFGANNTPMYIFEFKGDEAYVALYEFGGVNVIYTIKCPDREKLCSILELIF